MIQPPPFALNNAVDSLLKNEFDHYREIQKPHPIFEENGIDAVPFKHIKINDWRNNFKGVQFLHKKTNLKLSGSITDLWVDKDTDEFVLVEYN